MGLEELNLQLLKTSQQNKQKSKAMSNIGNRIGILNKMYKNKMSVCITDFNTDGSGTKVSLELNKEL